MLPLQAEHAKRVSQTMPKMLPRFFESPEVGRPKMMEFDMNEPVRKSLGVLELGNKDNKI